MSRLPDIMEISRKKEINKKERKKERNKKEEENMTTSTLKNKFGAIGGHILSHEA
jgi:hypothetical protein